MDISLRQIIKTQRPESPLSAIGHPTEQVEDFLHVESQDLKNSASETENFTTVIVKFSEHKNFLVEFPCIIIILKVNSLVKVSGV